VHFKHCREIAQAIKGLSIEKAKKYLSDVLEYKAAIPFTKYTGGIGRHSYAKVTNTPGDKVAWPQKATKTFLDLLTNIQSNAESKGLDMDKVKITHACANQAPKMRRRTYRAHGRINAYMSSPAHIEIVASEVNDEVEKEEEVAPKMSRKQIAQKNSRIKVGGGAK